MRLLAVPEISPWTAMDLATMCLVHRTDFGVDGPRGCLVRQVALNAHLVNYFY
jgi:hypothetical protein